MREFPNRPVVSEAHEQVTLLHAGKERFPKNEGVKACPQLLRHRHDDI